MKEQKQKHGGKRAGAGHPVSVNRPHTLSIRVSDDVLEYLNAHANKTEYINQLIINDMRRV